MLKIYLLLLLGSSMAMAISTEELLDSVRRSMGGKDAINALKNLECRAQITSEDNAGTYYSMSNPPDRFYSETKQDAILTKEGIDKTGPWAMDMNEMVVPAEGDEAGTIHFKAQTSGWFCFSSQSGAKWEYAGEDAVGNYRLKMISSPSDGIEAEFLIDKGTGLPKTVYMLKGSSLDKIEYSDYRPVFGVLIPFRVIEESSAGTKIFAYNSITPLKPSMEGAYTRPESKQLIFMDTDSTTWSVTYLLNLTTVAATINGKGPFTFIVDTGASASMLDSKVAEECGIEKVGTMKIIGVGGGSQAVLGRVGEITVGQLHIREQIVGVMPVQDSVGKFIPGVQLGGIIGYDILNQFILEQDYVNSSLRLHQPDAFRQPSGMNFIPIEHKGGLITINCQLEGKEVRAIIDTGNTGNLHILPGFVEQEDMLKDHRTAPVWFRGAFGLDEGRVGRIESLEVAGFKLEGVEASFGGARIGCLADASHDINIGAGILRQFDVVFDYRNSRMGFKPNVNFGVREEPDRLGAALSPVADGLLVVEIDPEGSAAKAGILKGDIVTQIDDLIIDPRAAVNLRSYTRRPQGTKLNIQVKRGDNKLSFPVVLMDRY